MHDASESSSGEEPGTPRRSGPRHAAPEAGPVAQPDAASWRPPGGSTARRAAHRHASDDRPPPSPRHRGRWLALAAAVVAVLVVLVVALVRSGDDDPTPDAGGSATADSARPPAALVEWLRTELPRGGTVAAAPELRATLLEAGADAAVLPESAPGDGDAGTPALELVEAQPEGSRLLARFDRAGGAAPLLLVDPAPVEPTQEQLSRRQALAAAVLANPTTRAEGAVRQVLAAADVDARLLSLIAALAAREGIGLWAFPTAPGEEPGTAPARRVVVDAVGGLPVPADGAATQQLVAYLEAQLSPFAPDTVDVTGDGVLIGFHYVPGPDAVVSAATP